MSKQQQSFVDFIISKGYTPFRKVYNKEQKQWEYIPSQNNNNFFSCYSPGHMDIRLIKDNQEIIFGVPCDIVEGNKTKVHHPTLIWPPICGSPDNLFALDELFDNLTYEEIFNLILDYYSKN